MERGTGKTVESGSARTVTCAPLFARVSENLERPRGGDQGAAAIADVLGAEEPALAATPMMIPNITTPLMM